MRLSIVVICLNEEKNLPRCLRAIQKGNSGQWDLEVIVVDGGSKDASRDIARSLGARVIDASRGVPRQRNIGGRAASGDLLAFVDADIEVTPGWFECVCKNFQGVSSLMLGSPPMVSAQASWITRAFNLHLGVGPREGVLTDNCERFLATGSLVMHRWIFEKLGGFREDMPVDEDTDFVLRAQRLGISQRCDPKLGYIHHGEPATWLQFFARTVWGANYSSWFKALLRRERAMMWRPQYLYGMVTAVNAVLVGMTALGLLAGYSCLPLALLSVSWMCGCIILPGLLTSWRRGAWHFAPQLCALYAGMGLGHAVALLGVGRNKFRRWR